MNVEEAGNVLIVVVFLISKGYSTQRNVQEIYGEEHLMSKSDIHNLVIISDTHFGCQLALCPPLGIKLDEGGYYKPNVPQIKLWGMWEFFWEVWIPMVTRGEPYAVIHLGDCIDGVHHGSITQISHNFNDQMSLALEVLRPIIKRCDGRYYHIRGTEAHVGKSAQYEEMLARELGAIPDEEGRHARYELWIRVGSALCNFMHHIGTTGSNQYESSAILKELIENFVESAISGDEIPDVLGRGHRHRSMEVRKSTHKGNAYAFTCPAWQLKTPFSYKIAGARQAQPHIGGWLVKWDDEEKTIYLKEKKWTIKRPKTVLPSLTSNQ